MKLIPPTYIEQLSSQSEEGEFLIINRLIRNLAQPPFAKDGSIGKGIGDDAAVIPANQLGKYLLTSVDSFVETKHFLFSLSSPKQIGFKAVVTAASDIAAMGGRVQYLLINLHLPHGVSLKTAEGIYEGIDEAARLIGSYVIGGNLSSGAELSLGVTVLGSSDKPPLLRSGAKDGDDLWVSGAPGLSQLGMEILMGDAKYPVSEQIKEAATEKYQRPTARLELGEALVQLGASCAIDLSDGIIQDAGHLAHHSNSRIEIWLENLAISGIEEKQLIELLGGGGDYELLFTAPRSLRSEIEKLPADLKRCGAVSSSGETGVVLKCSKGLLNSTELKAAYLLTKTGNNHFPGSKN